MVAVRRRPSTVMDPSVIDPVWILTPSELCPGSGFLVHEERRALKRQLGAKRAEVGGGNERMMFQAHCELDDRRDVEST